MDIGLVLGVEYVVEVFVFPSKWYRKHYNFNQELIEKDSFLICMHNIEHRDYVIKEMFSQIIRSTSYLEAGPAKVPENGKLTWYKATVFIRISKYE